METDSKKNGCVEGLPEKKRKLLIESFPLKGKKTGVLDMPSLRGEITSHTKKKSASKKKAQPPRLGLWKKRGKKKNNQKKLKGAGGRAISEKETPGGKGKGPGKHKRVGLLQK